MPPATRAYIEEKLKEATIDLVSNHGRIKERLMQAYDRSLSAFEEFTVDEETIPLMLSLPKVLEALQHPDELTEADCSKLARNILEMYLAVTDETTESFLAHHHSGSVSREVRAEPPQGRGEPATGRVCRISN